MLKGKIAIVTGAAAHDLVADGGYLACGRPAETSVTATARRRSAGQLKTYA
jgi:hypothetical protein